PPHSRKSTARELWPNWPNPEVDPPVFVSPSASLPTFVSSAAPLLQVLPDGFAQLRVLVCVRPGSMGPPLPDSGLRVSMDWVSFCFLPNESFVQQLFDSSLARDPHDFGGRVWVDSRPPIVRRQSLF